MESIGIYPFGQPVLKVKQQDNSPKTVFMLGVYASAIYVKFTSKDKKISIRNLPVLNEPEMFWNGKRDDVNTMINLIDLPPQIGRLTAEDDKINGIVGRTLDKYFLYPLKLERKDIWFCNLIPHTMLNKNDRKVLKKYSVLSKEFGLPEANLPSKKERWNYLGKKRIREITEEIFRSRPETIVTLGQQPLKWFIKFFDPKVANTLGYKEYGVLHTFNFEGIKLKLLPLLHPRQVLKQESKYSETYLKHLNWVKSTSQKRYFF